MKRASQMIRYELYEHLKCAIMFYKLYKKSKKTLALFPPGVDIENIKATMNIYSRRIDDEIGTARGLGLALLFLTENAKGKFDVDSMKHVAHRIATIQSIVG